MDDNAGRDPRFADGRMVIFVIVLSLMCTVAGGMAAYITAMGAR